MTSKPIQVKPSMARFPLLSCDPPVTLLLCCYYLVYRQINTLIVTRGARRWISRGPGIQHSRIRCGYPWRAGERDRTTQMASSWDFTPVVAEEEQPAQVTSLLSKSIFYGVMRRFALHVQFATATPASTVPGSGKPI